MLASSRDRRMKFALHITIVLALVPIAANAQYGGSMAAVLNSAISASKSLVIAESSVYDTHASAARAGGQSSSGNNARTVPQPPRQYPITASDFRAAPGFLLPDQLATSTPNLKPEEREAVRSLYTNILTSFEREARKNNMANAFAFVVGASIQVADGKELSDAYVDKMIGYFNNRIASNPQFAAMPDQQKRALYEALILTGGLIAFLDAQGKQTNDPAMRGQAAEMSKAVLKQFTGIDIGR